MTAPLSVTTASDQLLCRIAGIGDLFAIEGEFVTGKEIPSGHINTTYKATYRKSDGTEDSYILQRINDYVFKDPKAVMRNVEKVTRHINWKVLRRLKDSAGQTLNLYPARGGRNYIDIPGDGIWRCYNYLAGTHTYDVVENTRQAYQAGFAFGSFQDLISDMNPDDIVETIPGFHHTRNRFNRLMEVAELDPQGRLSTCLPELEFIKAREQDVDRLLNLQERGVLPTRITHNDTKINNVMLDEDTDHAVCVIDLDTVMPGLVLYDFGDMVRTVTPPTEEDEEDLDKVRMRMPMFQSIVEGYLTAAHGFLTQAEIDQLAFSGKLITLEIGIRFLTDYLEGDPYFKVSRPNHNLIRCRTQLKLVECIEQELPAMEQYVKRVARGDVQKIGKSFSFFHSTTSGDGYAVPSFLYYLNMAAHSIIQETLHAIAKPCLKYQTSNSINMASRQGSCSWLHMPQTLPISPKNPTQAMEATLSTTTTFIKPSRT